jgi:hypothetical protein
MLKEKEIRDILNEFKMQRINLNLKISEPELKEKYYPEYVLVNEKIILLETILEESQWQKLMNQHKKENVFLRRFNFLCDYLFRGIN